MQQTTIYNFGAFLKNNKLGMIFHANRLLADYFLDLQMIFMKYHTLFFSKIRKDVQYLSLVRGPIHNCHRKNEFVVLSV